MADILQITEDIPVDDSIYEYEYKEYNPIVGTDLNRGSIVITIESQDIYTHPSESFLIVEGQLLKKDPAPGPNPPAGSDDPYNDADQAALINNGIMYLFSDVRFHLASHEIEVLQNPGHATTMLGMLKYPDDYNKSQGLNQLWFKDENEGEAEIRTNQDEYNKGFDIRHKYIIRTSNPKGSFEFKIPLKHFLGFCEDYKKILYGMQQRLTLTRTGDNDAIFRNIGAATGKIRLNKIRWFMPHVIPSDAYRLQLDKIIERKEKIPVGYRMLQCDSTQVPARVGTFTWRLGVKSSPDIPRFIIVGFQTDKNNIQIANPALFDHLYVRNIYVTLNAKRYPDTDYNNDFDKNQYSRIYGDATLFRKRFFNMDELLSNSGIEPIDYKNLFPLFVFDVSKQSEKLKTSVSDIHIKAFFNPAPAPAGAAAPANPGANTMAYAVIISDRLFHFVSDGSKITNIV